MSVYSTLRLTRNKVKELIFDKLCNVTDEELEEVADAILRERLYNCRIVDNLVDNDNDLV